jgi:hypothetical protein
MGASDNQPPQDVQDWFAALGVADADRHERTLWARLIRLARQLRQESNAIQARDAQRDSRLDAIEARLTKGGL